MIASQNLLLHWSIIGFLAVSLVEDLAGAAKPEKRALVFGGTQFMGRWTVERLLSEGYKVTVFNRGETPNPWPKSVVKRLKADRMKDREKFKKILRKNGFWDVVIDFTGFHENFIHDAVEGLQMIEGEQLYFLVGHYIYISTDSVYWDLKLPNDDSRLNESSAQAFSPEEYVEHEKYAKMTRTGEYQIAYGGNKLSCDMFLQKVFESHGFPFTSLRLPDVYGPYDNQGGFWKIVDTVRSSGRLGAMLPPGRIRPRGSGKALLDHSKFQVTWVFVADVVDAIMAVIAAGHEAVAASGRQSGQLGSKVTPPFGEIYHIAHEEAVSLQEVANLIFHVAKESPKLHQYFPADGAVLDYDIEADNPTTDFGALDIGKAKHHLKWRPRPMREAVQVAIEWYSGARQGYPTDIEGKHHEL